MAGAVGIEPTQVVLETTVLPLYDAPLLPIISNPASAGLITWFPCEEFACGSAYNIS